MTIFKDSHHFSKTLGDVWWQSLKTVLKRQSLMTTLFLKEPFAAAVGKQSTHLRRKTSEPNLHAFGPHASFLRKPLELVCLPEKKIQSRSCAPCFVEGMFLPVAGEWKSLTSNHLYHANQWICSQVFDAAPSYPSSQKHCSVENHNSGEETCFGTVHFPQIHDS